MPRRSPKLIVAETRVSEARRAVAAQQVLIAGLQNAGAPTLDAEKTLQTLESMLKHLEQHERKLRDKCKAKMGETKKRRRE